MRGRATEVLSGLEYLDIGREERRGEKALQPARGHGEQAQRTSSTDELNFELEVRAKKPFLHLGSVELFHSSQRDRGTPVGSFGASKGGRGEDARRGAKSQGVCLV